MSVPQVTGKIDAEGWHTPDESPPVREGRYMPLHPDSDFSVFVDPPAPRKIGYIKDTSHPWPWGWGSTWK